MVDILESHVRRGSFRQDIYNICKYYIFSSKSQPLFVHSSCVQQPRCPSHRRTKLVQERITVSVFTEHHNLEKSHIVAIYEESLPYTLSVSYGYIDDHQICRNVRYEQASKSRSPKDRLPEIPGEKKVGAGNFGHLAVLNTALDVIPNDDIGTLFT